MLEEYNPSLLPDLSYTGDTGGTNSVAVPPDDGQDPVLNWQEIDPYTGNGAWVDFNGQSGVAWYDADGNGIALDQPGEYVAFFDANTHTAITYAAEPGTLTGGQVGVDGLVLGAQTGSNGHVYVSAGFGTPGFSISHVVSQDIQGLGTGWSANYSVGRIAVSATPSGTTGYGFTAPGIFPSVSLTFGVDLTQSWHDSLDAVNRLDAALIKLTLKL